MTTKHPIQLIIVEDNHLLRRALKSGLESTGQVAVTAEFSRGEDILEAGSLLPPDVILMDVHLAGEQNGIRASVNLRKEYPRLPIVFYSIQDDDEYYRDFLRSRILTHFAYVRKSNYLMPAMVLPLLQDAIAGRSYIDPEIETRVQQVRYQDENDPLELLEPNELAVAGLLAQGMTNEQIAARLNYHDARAVSRTNGQIYTAWGLNSTSIDEKVARTRAALIYQKRQMITWDKDGIAWIETPGGKSVELVND
jgi:DNA-binding NarL/FixJ family response regulator